MKKERKMFVKVSGDKALIMPRGWKPSMADDAFEYPGRGDTALTQWLATFEDKCRMPDGRPALAGLFFLARPELGTVDVAADAIRLARQHGLDTTRARRFKLYELPGGDCTDFSEVAFHV